MLITLLCCFLGAVCALRSRTRLFWIDELYGARVVDARTFRDLLRGWYQGADGGGLLYYLLARLWADCFGFSELTLRLFSTAGMAAALAFTWAAARRYFSTVAVALAVGAVFLSSPLMLWQELNGRFYGLFLASCAFACLVFLVTAETETPSRRHLLWTTLAHTCLVGSHILGIIYSFSLLVATLALDRARHRSRPPLYAAIVLAWLLIIPVSYHAIHSSSAIATTTFWTAKPHPSALLLPFAMYGRLTGILLVGALLLWIATALKARRSDTIRTHRKLLPAAALALVGGLLLAQLILFAKSQFGISIYADRYLLPISIVSVFLFALCLARILPLRLLAPQRTSSTLLVATLGLLPFCAFALSRHVYADAYPSVGYPQRVTAAIPPGAMILGGVSEFDLLARYDHAHTPVFMLNRPYQHDHPGPGDWDTGLMENWRRAGYETGRILPCPVLFTRYSDLYVFEDVRLAPWFNDRLRYNPNFEVHELAHDNEWVPLTVWSVHRLRPGPPPC